jgi:peptidoglycan/xylan/chitin deacetylase (PgdA/CDA1 family)
VKLTAGLKKVAKPVAAMADVGRLPRRGIVVLAYHRVGGRSGIEIDLPIDAFERQIEEVARRGAISLDATVQRLAQPSTVSTDPIAVTFDDGTVDFVEAALPVLVRHGVPATIYVATAFVEEQRPFPHNGRPLSWAALADACSTGLVTVGSHTHTHLLLDRVDGAKAQDELRRSVELIATKLGQEARHFAYPKGVAGSPGAAAAVRQHFVSAALGGTRPNRYGSTDLHRLARTPVQVSDGWRWFERKLAGGMQLEDLVRQRLNRRRYADIST